MPFKSSCVSSKRSFVPPAWSRTKRACLGKNLEHIKLDLMEPDASSGIFPGIAFNLAGKFPVIQSGTPFDICYSIELNEFRGKTNLQLNIRDLKTKTC